MDSHFTLNGQGRPLGPKEASHVAHNKSKDLKTEMNRECSRNSWNVGSKDKSNRWDWREKLVYQHALLILGLCFSGCAEHNSREHRSQVSLYELVHIYCW